MNNCSYCNIKKAKGHVLSRSEEEVEADVRNLYAAGVRTATLLGDDCGSYGLDRDSNLPKLLVRLGGDYCPMRNEEYINTHIRAMGLDRPYFPISVTKQIDIGAPCGARCLGCDYAVRSLPRPIGEIIRDIQCVPPEYTRVELYGGDALLRDDLFSVLGRVPRTMEIALWTACSRVPDNGQFIERLRSYRIAAVKVQAADPSDALRHMRSMIAWGLPVQLYVPMDRLKQAGAAFSGCIDHLGIERLYAFTKAPDRSQVNPVACFGKGLERVRLLWVHREQAITHA